MNTSNCGLQQDSNNEDNTSISRCSLVRSSITGGDTGSWVGSTSLCSVNSGNEAVAYNGYLYVLGSTDTVTFNYTGASQSFCVPTGVTSVNITAYGAQGGSLNHVGGLGGKVTYTLTTTPGETLLINV